MVSKYNVWYKACFHKTRKIKITLSIKGLAAVRSNAVVLLLFIYCRCRFLYSMFCCPLLYVHSGFAIISIESFALFVFLVSRGCCVALPRGATGLYAVCDYVFLIILA